MRVVFAGTPATAVPALQALLHSAHDVIAVVTRPDARVGRGRQLQRSPVGEVADEVGIPVLTPIHPRDESFITELSALGPDCCPVVAYGALIPSPVLAVPRLGWVNLHFSLLPAWRGAAPVQHAIWHGDDVTGATTFVLDEGMDTGPVLGTVTETIDRDDTTGTLLARLAESGAELLLQTLNGLATGQLAAVAQPLDGASTAPKLDPEDARINFGQPAIGVDRHIRACTPAPGAWTQFRSHRLGLAPILHQHDAPPEAVALGPGELLSTRRAVWVGTATQPVQLSMVQPAGKKIMSAPDWARGSRLVAGEALQ